MRDRIGNALAEGQLVFWASQNTVAKIVTISEPKLAVVGSREPRLATITVQIAIALDTSGLAPGADTQIAEFIRVIDPAQERLLGEAMAGGRAQ